MKNLFKILLITLLVASCSSNQPGSAIVKDNDELTLNAKELLKSYVENDFSLWEELFSDDCEVQEHQMLRRLLKKKTKNHLSQLNPKDPLAESALL